MPKADIHKLSKFNNSGSHAFPKYSFKTPLF